MRFDRRFKHLTTSILLLRFFNFQEERTCRRARKHTDTWPRAGIRQMHLRSTRHAGAAASAVELNLVGQGVCRDLASVLTPLNF